MLSEFDSANFARLRGRLPAILQDVLRKYPAQAVIAGGYYGALLDGRTPNDIDIFVPTEDIKAGVLKIIFDADRTDEYYSTHETIRATTITSDDEHWITVQVITRPFTGIRELLETFDLSAAQAAIYYEASGTIAFTVYTTPDFDDTRGTRELLVTSTATPHDTFYRAIRYAGYGFKITPPVLAYLIKLAVGAVGLDALVSGRKELATAFEECPAWKATNGEVDYPEAGEVVDVPVFEEEF